MGQGFTAGLALDGTTWGKGSGLGPSHACLRRMLDQGQKAARRIPQGGHLPHALDPDRRHLHADTQFLGPFHGLLDILDQGPALLGTLIPLPARNGPCSGRVG